MKRRSIDIAIASALAAVVGLSAIGCADVDNTRPEPPPHEHSYAVVETKEPTCTQDGYSVYKCDCGDSYRGDEKSALGHDYTDWEITESEHSKKCNRCDDIQRGEHTPTGGTCTVCGYAPPRKAKLTYVLSEDGESYAVDGIADDGDGDIAEIPQTYDGKAVKAINAHAFENSEISTVVLPEGLEKIGAGAFAGTGKLRSIAIPSTVTEWGSEAFKGSGVQSVEINCESVVGSAFYGSKALRSVTLSDSVKKINANAFYACTALESVVFPQTGVTIYSSAFGYTSALKSVELPAGTKWVNSFAFWHSGVKNVTLHCGVGGGAFEACESLETVVVDLPENTKATIGAQAFKDSALKSITISDGITTIDALAFANCKNLKTIDIPNTVTRIGTTTISKSDRGVFMGSGLTEIVIPDSVETLNDKQAFENCKDLRSIHFGKNCNANSTALYRFSELLKGCNALETITVSDEHPHYYAKNDCLIYKRYSSRIALDKMGKNATAADIPSEVVRIGQYAFYGNTELTSFTIPENIVEIELYAFYGCTNLKTVSLPNTLKSIGANSFENCGLTEIAFPTSLTRISEQSFKGCASLTKAVFSDPAGWSAFTPGEGSANAEALVLTDHAVNARYLTDDYCEKTWSKD